MFHVGDTVIKPSIGICKIKAIRRLEIEDRTEDYYVIQSGDVDVMVPRKLADHGALRTPMSEESLKAIYQELESPFRPVNVHPSALEIPEVYRIQVMECKEILKKRNPHDLVGIIRTLYNKQNDYNLEKKEDELLNTALNMLVEEIAYLEKTTKGRIKTQINKLLAAGRKEGRRILAAEEA